MARTLIGNIKGPKGDTGETGATGATGAAGASASVSVGTVTALEYGNNPTVTNSGSAQNAVFNFGIPKGKPADNITELDNLPVNSSVTPSADFPVPAVGDTSKTILGKIIKWFGDMSALVATKFNAANVYNGLDKTESGYALDARQGKALNDTKLNVANVVNNLTTTESGYALDARQGKALNDRYGRYATYDLRNNMASDVSIFGGQYLVIIGDLAFLYLCFYVTSQQSSGKTICTLPSGYTYQFIGNVAENVWGSPGGVATLNIYSDGVVKTGTGLAANAHIGFALIGRAIAN